MRRLIVLAFTALLLFAVVPTAAAAGKGRGQGVAGVRVTEGIVFGQGRVNAPAAGRVDLRLDLYEPLTRSNGRRPAVLLIHGGGFVGGSRDQPDLVRVARGLAERGTVVLSIDYRLLGQQPVPSPRVAPVEAAAPDVPIFTAIQYVFHFIGTELVNMIFIKPVTKGSVSFAVVPADHAKP